MLASRRELLAAAGAVSALPLLSAFARPAGNAGLRTTVDALAEDYLTLVPETATNLGLDSGARGKLAAQLDDLSRAGVAKRAAFFDGYARRVGAIDRASLD